MRDSFLRCIQESYKCYLEYGSRSTRKLKPAHRWLADVLRQRLPDDYDILGMRDDDPNAREEEASGLYYDKKIDVAVKRKNTVVSGIGFKFVTSNYKQNSVNYFENVLGETANLQRAGIGYGSLMVLPSVVRYLTKSGEFKKEEIISSHNLKKYLHLYHDRSFPHKPEAVGLIFVDIDYDNKNVLRLTNIDDLKFSDEITNFLKTDVGLEHFLKVFTKMSEYKGVQLCR